MSKKSDTIFPQDSTELIENKSHNIFAKIFKGDKVVWAVFIILCLISIVEMFSATSTLVYKQHNQWSPILRHSGFLLLGVVVIWIIHRTPYKYFSLLTFMLFISILLLILTALTGTTINGAERWYKIFGISLQPSEFAKISLMGTIAFLLSKQDGKNDGFLFKWMIGLMVVVCGIIALDNLSTAALLFLVCFLMMFIGNVKIRRLMSIIGTGVVCIVLLLLIMMVIPQSNKKAGKIGRMETWKNRLINHNGKKDKKSDDYYLITDENYQVAHAKIAVANGGLLGAFPGNSKERDYLPQAYSDFIYAIIIEEMGLIGAIVVWLLYVILLMRAGIIAQRIKKAFPRYLVMGSALMLSIQAFINMAVAVNIIPVTGQPMPLISRGGTSTLITCAYFGLILSADIYGMGKKKNKLNKEEFEADNNVHNQESLQENETESTLRDKKKESQNDSEKGIDFEVYQP